MMPFGTKVDFLCETGSGFVALEQKAGRDWQRRFNLGLEMVGEDMFPAPVKNLRGLSGKEKSRVQRDYRFPC